MFGTFLIAAIPTNVPTVIADIYAVMLDISKHFAHRACIEIFLSAIPTGFLVAVMIWMLPSSKNFEIWTIALATHAMTIADNSHIIVGFAELFLVLLNGESGLLEAIARLLLAATGNIIGGTVLFAVIAYAQVNEGIRCSSRRLTHSINHLLT